MLIYKGTEYRNLEEQVRQNKEDIARHYEIDRALANLGIEVVGQVATPSELPDPLTYQGAFGDTYAVGDPAAVNAGTGYYTYYVFTRPDENAGNPENHWLNVGRISIVGPQGVPGPQGPQGERGESSTWIAANTLLPAASFNPGDMFLVTEGENAGNVYFRNLKSASWTYKMNIKGPQGSAGMPGREGPQGPQGERGPKGERGDVGGFINIVGILASTSLLPLPSSVRNLTYAYLVGAAAPYDLYVQVGEDSASSVWTNTGPFNAATAVSVGGVYQNVWDADTKLDKPPTTSGFNRAAGVDTANNSIYYSVQYPSYDYSGAGTVARMGIPYMERGQLSCSIPTADYSAANKKYVDDNFRAKYNRTAAEAGLLFVYTQNQDGVDNVLQLTNTVMTEKSTIPFRDHRGCIAGVGTPQNNDDAANKQYVDANTHVLTRISTGTSTEVGSAYVTCKKSDVVSSYNGVLAYLRKIGATVQHLGIPFAIGSSVQKLWAEPDAPILHIGTQDVGKTPTWEIVDA